MSPVPQPAGLAGRSARELTGMLSSGAVSAREVLEDHLAVVGDRNGELNAICTLTEEVARSDAARADEAYAHGYLLGPLHGLPILHKDLLLTKGVSTTFGSLTHRTNIPDVDATPVARCRAAGAIFLGKTNTPQFGTGGHTSNRLFGTTCNPVDPALTAGGSSGGSAAAVAAGMAPLATGTDMAGSLRVPAAFCGVVGMRPSIGRIPLWPPAAMDVGMTVAGPMARTVDDAVLLFSVLAGHDPRSGRSRPEPAAGLLSWLDRRSPMRAAWSPTPGGIAVDPEIAAVAGQLPDLLEGSGVRVEFADPELPEARECFEILRGREYVANYAYLLYKSPELLEPLAISNIEKGRAYTDQDLARAEGLRETMRRRIEEFFSRFDLLLLPGCPVLPFPATQWTPDGGDSRGGTGYLDWLEPQLRLSVVGVPVVVVPVGRTRTGLPVSVQVVAAPGRDREALEYARLVESLVPAGGLAVRL